MKMQIQKLFLSLVVVFFTSFNAVAEDIQLYVGNANSASNIRPNVLFIVDTSGSMSSKMQITIPQTVTLTTTSTTGDLIVLTFDSGVDGFSGSVSNSSQKLKIPHNIETEQTFSFPSAKANKYVSLDLELTPKGGWETWGRYRDYFIVKVNGSIKSSTSYTDNKTVTVSINNIKLDSSAKVKISLLAKTSSSSEYALVDNFMLGNQSGAYGFNPSKKYPGCHDEDKIYIASRVQSLSCAGNYYKKSYFYVSDNQCDYLTKQIAAHGYATGVKGAYWVPRSNPKKSRWKNVSPKYSGKYKFECKKDAGKHGANSSSSAKYAANGKDGPYTNKWYKQYNFKKARGYFSGNYLNYVDCTSKSGCASSSSGGTTMTTTTTTGTTNKSVTRTRLQVAQYVLNNIINSTSNINMGLMRFDSYSRGGYVVTAMDKLENNKTAFKTELDAMRPGGGTPLAETLYESMLYYQGSNLYHGVSPRGNYYQSDQTDPKAFSGSKYISPIKYQCQKSFVVLLTDGSPYADTGDDSKIKGLTGFRQVTGRSSCSGNCLDELAKIIYETDQISTLARDQNISTYTIAMGDDLGTSAVNLLKATATNAGGKYYSANNYTELLSAFTSIITEINSVNTTFTSPAVSVNAFNRTTNRNDLYYSLFKPEGGPYWGGNIKKFRLKFNNGVGRIVDANDKDAIDPATGYFSDDAQSYWITPSQSPDGGNVELGGAAAKIPAGRTVYTNIAGGNISARANRVLVANAAALTSYINSSLSTTEIEKVIKWANGYDVDGVESNPRMQMGDPLHSRPVVIQYGGTEAKPDLTIFSANNSGFLNAIKESTGETIFSFIPKELLSNLDDLYEDDQNQRKIYGLDGAISAWVKDDNEDGIINGSDRVIIYFGMRRGGSNYYALDVTSRTAPKLLWTIKGGSGDFTELGQTWSYPAVKDMMIAGSKRKVLIFGGGYDTNQDSNTEHEDDSIGRAVYIVDALTGQRLWWAGPIGSGADMELATMTNSIPAEILAVEMFTGKGVNRLYVSDMRGQIFRFDINLKNTGVRNLVKTGYRLAKLSVENSTEGTRRFYYPPDAALMKGYIAVVIGSGYRSQPLETSEQNRIYMIKDTNVFKSPKVTPATITESDLVKVDTLANSKAEKLARAKDLANGKGWYFNLGTGEKVLAKPVILDGTAILTSFTPTSSGGASASNSCAPGSGGGAIYFLDLGTGRPELDLDNSGSITVRDRYKVLKRPTIPPAPLPVTTKEGTVIPIDGTPMELPKKDALEKTYWYENRSSNAAAKAVSKTIATGQ